MSQATTLARPYARALFMVAKQEGRLKECSETLGFSAEAVVMPEVAALLGNPRIDEGQLLGLLGHPESSDAMNRFLAELSRNGRLALLPEIYALYEMLRAESDRVLKATITSAESMSPESLKSLTEALKKRFGSEVDVLTAVDASLIGGAVIDVGDVVIDGSVRNKLARLNASLAN